MRWLPSIRVPDAHRDGGEDCEEAQLVMGAVPADAVDGDHQGDVVAVTEAGDGPGEQHGEDGGRRQERRRPPPPQGRRGDRQQDERSTGRSPIAAIDRRSPSSRPLTVTATTVDTNTIAASTPSAAPGQSRERASDEVRCVGAIHERHRGDRAGRRGGGLASTAWWISPMIDSSHSRGPRRTTTPTYAIVRRPGVLPALRTMCTRLDVAVCSDSDDIATSHRPPRREGRHERPQPDPEHGFARRWRVRWRRRTRRRRAPWAPTRRLRSRVARRRVARSSTPRRWRPRPRRCCAPRSRCRHRGPPRQRRPSRQRRGLGQATPPADTRNP